MLRTLLLVASLTLSVIALSAITVKVSAQDIHVPASLMAGDETSISTTGSGKATFYLLGPGVSRKGDVNLGEDIKLQSRDLQGAGNYLALVCSGECRSATFYVSPAKPATLTFLVHPSRVPVALSDSVSGVAFPFDQFHNLVLTPLTIDFELSVGSSSIPSSSMFSRQIKTQNGAAWFRTSSGKSSGAVLAVATVGDVSTRRAVQQVASDPCNLRIKGERTKTGLVVETEPVHDCAGNVVSDGTIVTFTANEGKTRSTVDAPIKQGIARAQISGTGAATISVASGVVIGNDLRIEAK
jgi:hypothetical protein